uniref:Adenosine 3'-phospho 5'-phosphosulfate transporter 2 n=2 Tax=Schistocephalus solidus TaxID=70667 RepID=A0A0V0JAD8_SCHSO
MIVGLVFFTLTDVQVQPNFEIKGVIAISIALCADGYIGNLQELAMKKYQLSSLQIMAYSYVNGFLILFFYLVGGFALVPAVKFASTEPITVFVYGSIFAVTGYFGIQFVLLLVHHFGALPAVTVTTLRKAVTIVLSFAFFAKPFAFGYLWSGAMVAFGIYLSAYSKARESRRKKVLDDPSLHPSNGSVLHVV